MSGLRATFNDRDDRNDRYTTHLAQRQEQAQIHFPAHLHEFSRPSSSSGSIGTNSLRRKNRFPAEDVRPSRLRSSSLESQKRRQDPLEEQEDPSPRTHRRATSAHYSTSVPHPALRISRRTHSAILYALEEAIRKPNPFTVDEYEENAQMSDLGGRASNGGARATGPVPVSGGSTPAAIRTPREIMRDRVTREAKRQEQQREEERRREEEHRLVAEEKRRSEERRKSAERRAAVTVPGAVPRFSNTSSQYSPDVSAGPGAFDGASDRHSRVAGEVAGTNVLGEPTGRSSADFGHRRGPSSVSQSDQPRPATAGASRRAQPGQAIPRQTVAGPTPRQSSAPPPASTLTGENAQRNTTSSFPHAFERWETLSSHWEGLTSYWLHKLEQNTEEIRETIPNASTLNRQITDLSAAGANLFHAVVELQRLRASSERKFQRWFFETRADNERNREVQASLERSLAEERKVREQVAAVQGTNSEEVEASRREVAEMRRELAISKDEARRAWEELGRRNQESLDLSQSLKEGRVTIVGGVQVVPWFGQGGTSVSQGGQGRSGYVQSERDDEAQYYHQDPAAAHASAASPTNTDPFTEGGRRQVPLPLHHETGNAYLPTAAPSANRFAAATTQATPSSHLAATTASASGSSGSATAFYQQSHAPQVPSHPGTQVRTQEVRSEGSYVTSEGDTEYAIDPSGNIRRDEHGEPVVFNRRTQESRASDGEGNDFDGEGVEAPEVPAGEGPDYEGQGFEGYQQYVPRHHHPTRLSDVLEEEEERSSRRTGGGD